MTLRRTQLNTLSGRGRKLRNHADLPERDLPADICLLSPDQPSQAKDQRLLQSNVGGGGAPEQWGGILGMEALMSCQVAPAPLCHVCCSSSPTPTVPSEQAEPQSSIWGGWGIGEMVRKGWPAVLPWPAAAPEGPELNCSCGKPQPALKFILDR